MVWYANHRCTRVNEHVCLRCLVAGVSICYRSPIIGIQSDKLTSTIWRLIYEYDDVMRWCYDNKVNDVCNNVFVWNS